MPATPKGILLLPTEGSSANGVGSLPKPKWSTGEQVALARTLTGLVSIMPVTVVEFVPGQSADTYNEILRLMRPATSLVPSTGSKP